MNSKFLSRRNNLPKNNKDMEEIIEIEDIPSSKPVRVQISQKKKKKDFAENSSSEATTPNKKKKIKKKNDDLIEIMDADITELDKKKASFPALRQKKSKSILPSKKNKKIEKESIQSIPSLKLKGKSKSPIFKDKRKSKISSINLYGNNIDEESDIQMNVYEKLDSHKNGKYGENNINSYKNGFISQNKKYKKIKIINKHNDKSSQQIELLSEDSGNEEYMQMLPQKRKKNNKYFEPSSTINTGSYSSNKISRKENENPNKKDDKKSRSIIKTSSKQDQFNHMNNLLGKKRKPEKKSIEPITPKKKNGKSITPIKNYLSSNNSIPSQIIANKSRPRTPIKTIGNKNNIMEDLREPKIGANDKSPKNDINSNTLEIAVLSQLVDKFGLESVLDSLCQPNLNINNELDSCLQGLKASCDDNRITLMMCKMIFTFFYSKIKEKKDLNHEKEKVSSPPIISEIPDTKSISNNSMNDKEKLKYEIDKSPSKSNIKCNSSVLSMMDQCIGGGSIQTEDKDKQSQVKKEIKALESNKNTKVKDIKKEEGGKQGKKIMSIGSHYNKEETGKIYKYQVSSLDGKGYAIFKCYDDRCNGMAIYELETKKFVKTNIHKLNHGEHEYIMNNEKDSDEVFKQLIEKDKSDAQVFKENGERIVKYY